MTASTNTMSIVDRLKDDNPVASKVVKETVTFLALAGIAIKNPVTLYDYCQASEALLDALNPMTAESEALLAGLPVTERPTATTDDTRPLYQRLDDEDPTLVRLIRKYSTHLQIASLLIENDSLRSDYRDAAKAFIVDGLGLPTDTDLRSNPGQFPGVGGI